MFTAEHALVNCIKEWSGSGSIGDDCALIAGGHLLTTDTLVEGTHFAIPLISWGDLGWKAIAVNLSDIAAMAGRPRHVLTSITVAPHLHKSDFEALFKGMVECCKQYQCQIVGGDLTRGTVISITVTVHGDVHENGMLSRAGAKPGDVIAVTGDFGASAAGWWLLENRRHEAPNFPHCREAHVHPLPRLCEAWSAIRATGDRGALMDASDGLADALVQIARLSKVGMQVDLEKLPINEQTISAAKLAKVNPLDWALYGGEDYELVACIPQSVWDGWQTDNPFRMIGHVTESHRIVLKMGHADGPEINLSKCFEQISF